MAQPSHFAPRARRSDSTMPSLPASRATRNKRAPRAASRRPTACAIAEVAPAMNTRGPSAIAAHPAPEARRERRIQVALELGEAWEARCESVRRHARILRRVDGAAVRDDGRLEPVEQGERPVAAHR